MPISIVTNGTLMNEAHQDMLLSPIIQQVNFSLQSFHANFPNANNSTFLNKIFSFTKRAFTERPDLHINYRLWNTSDYSEVLGFNKDLIEKMRSFFNLGEDCGLTHTSLRGMKVLNSLHLNIATRFDWPSLQMPMRTTEGTCPGLITQLGILADGTVVPCCLDKDGVIDLGSSFTSTISDILNTSRAVTIEHGFRSRSLTEELCRHCTFIKRFEKKVRWIKGHQTWTNH